MDNSNDFTQDIIKDIHTKGSYQPPSATKYEEETVHLIKVLTDHESFLNILRAELRGEQIFEDNSTHERYFAQTDKPTFIKLDRLNKPLRVMNERTGKEEYICNDDAINEVINIVKLCGLNPVSPLTAIDENEIRADLMEMESKIAVMLFSYRKSWGLAKPEYPIVLGKLKILIKDARYRAKDGIVLKALRTITSRIEQSSDVLHQRGMMDRIKSPFT